MADNKGMVLIVSLWALIILSIIAVALSNIISPQIKFARVMEERVSGLAAAEAAFRFAFFARRSDKTPDYDSLFELSQETGIDLGRAKADCRLIDEGNKVNINTASKEIIMRLPGLNDEEVADSIIDSRSNSPISVPEELLLIEGVSQQSFSQFKDLITTAPVSGVNINTAPGLVLMALGFTDDLIELLLRYRIGDDTQEATEDDNTFKSVAAIISDLNNFMSLSQSQTTQLQSALNQGLLSVGSKVYTAEIQVKLLEQPGNNFKVLFDAVNNRVLRWEES